MELELIGPNRDLHSGHYGGSVVNPINELSRIINHLHDNQNRVTIPGFYNDVIEYSKLEREKMKGIRGWGREEGREGGRGKVQGGIGNGEIDRSKGEGARLKEAG